MNLLQPKKNPRNSIKSQKGLASIVFITLVSLALTTTSIGLIHSYKSSQQITVAANAVTHAQNGMWLGAEAFRRYLESLSVAQVTALSNQYNITLSDGQSIKISNVASVPNAGIGTINVTANLEHKHTTSQTSSALKLVYRYQPPVQPPSKTDPLQIAFDGNLDLDGGINIVDDGNPVTLAVDGNVTLGSISINPLHEIKATGKVTLESSAFAESIYSNENVVLSGSASADFVYTRGTFTISGGGVAKNVYANGEVNYGTSNSESVNSLVDITFTGGVHGTATAGGNLLVKGNRYESLNAVGNIKFNAWVGQVTSVISEGDIICPNSYWKVPDFISGNPVNCHDSLIPQPAPAVEVMEPVEPYTHSGALIDVWTRKDSANYFIEYDTTAGKIKVTVKNINGIADGSTYYIGSYADDHKTYLCTAVDSAGSCTAPSEPLFPLCLGNSLWNGCISYDTSTGKFTLSPAQTAPGVMFFHGDLHLDSGHPITAILVSGNITNGGSFKSSAPNFGDYSKVCEGEGSHVAGGVKSRYEAEYSEYYPTNFCDTGSSTYLPSQLGNVALAAGGFPPDTPGIYTGGNINLAASTNIVGAVLAGDVLTTNGNVQINGLITAGADGTSTTSSSLSGSTTIDFNSSNPNYSTTNVPDFSSPPPAPQSATLLWVRNL